MDADPDPAPGGREWAVPVVGVLAVVVGASVVFGGLFVVGTTPSCACSPPGTDAGASIDAAENGSTVAVTFTGNQNADHLLVETEPVNGSVTVANTTGDATRTDDGVRLTAVGDAVTYAPADASRNTTVEVSVVAYPLADSDASPSGVAFETVTIRPSPDSNSSEGT